MQISKHRIILAFFATFANCALSANAAAAEEESKISHAGHHMSMAGHMNHDQDRMWMFEYRYMRMNMSGLLDGTNEVSTSDISGASGDAGAQSPDKPYWMAPTSMSMDMHMFMAMYGITQQLSVMAMGNYVANTMAMAMHHHMSDGDTEEMHANMETSGLGDTLISLSYAASDPLTLTLGLSLPTGSNEEEVQMMPGQDKVRAGYSMQLGSGTFDLEPSLTWNRKNVDHQWGYQASYVYHLGAHNGYTFGNKLEASAWTKHQIDPGVWAGARLAVSSWGSIDGRDEKIDSMMSPDMDPKAQGGTRADALFGLSGGNPKGLTIGLEFGLPVYQNLNGPQMKTTLIASGSLQWMF